MEILTKKSLKQILALKKQPKNEFKEYQLKIIILSISVSQIHLFPKQANIFKQIKKKLMLII